MSKPAATIPLPALPLSDTEETPNPEDSRFAASLVDQFLLCTHETFTGDMHCILSFDGQLDADRLKRATALSMINEPVLSSRLVDHWLRPYWLRTTGEMDDLIFSAAEVREPDSALHEFLTTVLDPSNNPQVQIRLLRGSTDTLAIKMTHVVGDGASLLNYIYSLAELYGRLGTEPDYLPTPRPVPPRSTRDYIRQLGLHRPEEVRRFTRGLRKDPLLPGPWKFPAAPQGAAGARHIVHRFSQERGSIIQRDARQRKVTVNLMVLTAFYRALGAVVPRFEDRAVNFPMTVNLRPFLPAETVVPVCNLSGAIRMKMRHPPESSFDEVLSAARDEMRSQKQRYTGFGSMPLYLESLPIAKVWRVLPFWTLKRFISRQTAKIRAGGGLGVAGMTFAAQVDPKRASFGEVNALDAFAAAGIPTLSGMFPLVVSSFGDSLTLSVGLSAGNMDQSVVRRVLEHMDENLPG